MFWRHVVSASSSTWSSLMITVGFIQFKPLFILTRISWGLPGQGCVHPEFPRRKRNFVVQFFLLNFYLCIYFIFIILSSLYLFCPFLFPLISHSFPKWVMGHINSADSYLFSLHSPELDNHAVRSNPENSDVWARWGRYGPVYGKDGATAKEATQRGNCDPIPGSVLLWCQAVQSRVFGDLLIKLVGSPQKQIFLISFETDFTQSFCEDLTQEVLQVCKSGKCVTTLFVGQSAALNLLILLPPPSTG